MDFKKAFDSLEWSKIDRVLELQGMPPGLRGLLLRLYEGAQLKVKVGRDRHTESFAQAAGVRQGSSLSPLVFALVLDWALKRYEETMRSRGWRGASLGRLALTYLGYADDLALRARSEGEAQGALTQIAGAARSIGLELNAAKTEVLSHNTGRKGTNDKRAQKERVMTQEGDGDEQRGWLLEWGGIGLPGDHTGAARKVMQRSWPADRQGPDYLLAWDDGEAAACTMTPNGWMEAADGTKQRLVRLGMRQLISEGEGQTLCPRCGDPMSDATALKFHLATGYCRKEKTTAQLRRLRSARQTEERQRGIERDNSATVEIRAPGGAIVKCVPEAKYLGTMVGGSSSREAERRCAIATSVVAQLKQVWRAKGVPRKLKAELYQTLVLSVALYNAECWLVGPAEVKVLERFQRATLQRICGGGRDGTEEHLSLESLCEKLGVPKIGELVARKRVLWATHLARDPEEGTLEMLLGEVKQKTAWGKLLLEDMEHYRLDVARLERDPYTGAEARELLWGEQFRRERTEKKKRGGTKGSACKSEKARKTQEERRERLQEQAEEREKQRRETTETINGKLWKRRRAKTFWVTNGEGASVEFKVKAEHFNENEGREEYEVEGVWFYKDGGGVYSRT